MLVFTEASYLGLCSRALNKALQVAQRSTSTSQQVADTGAWPWSWICC